MRKSNHERIRRVLRNVGDGMCVPDLADLLNIHPTSIATALTNMPDAYIDRWTPTSNKRNWKAVWCLADVPEDCPRPDKTPMEMNR